jgi:type II secretory pathway pseudopilin PulG
VSFSGGLLPAGGEHLPAGVSLIEVTIVMALMVLVTTISAPLMASSIDAGRGRQAAQYLAAQCRSARMSAIASSAATGLVFDKVGARWRWQRCTDGNGNGIRRADITRGRDACDPAVDLAELFAGVSIAVDASLPDPDGGPGSSDPVRFGASDLASFTPAGTATAGTVFLRTSGGVQFAVRVAGVTARTRVLRYESGRRQWVEV